MKLYKIRNWSTHFEKSQVRKVERASWVPFPLKHDGLGFRRIIAMDDGAAIYGAWVLIVQVAAKCPVRGVLADDNGPLDPQDLAAKTGCPESVFKRALEVCSSHKVGWILVDNWERSGSALSLQDRTGKESTGEERIPSNEGSSEPDKPASQPQSEKSDAPVLEFPTVGKSKTWTLRQSFVDKLAECFPDLDALGECRKALCWCEANKANRKTPDGMTRFLNGWMTRAQNGGRNARRNARPDDQSRERYGKPGPVNF